MDDVLEAKALISEIRATKRVDEGDGNDENANDLQQALRMLSEELYSKPTHFILELIQNADDNKYASDTSPHLTIVYQKDGFLWIGCNELGFSPKNVRAICRIGDSTKKVEGSRKGYIGEKGIGFKSVFKVADVVWISSGALSFQFDKTKPLGMIAPENCEFKHNDLLTEQTKFCFRIPNDKDRKLVERNLLGLRAELLLFLRQLRSIDIKIQSSKVIVEESFHLSRSDGEENGIKITSVSSTATGSGAIPSAPTEEVSRYMVLTREISNMPHEIKRPGLKSSDVVMAFPITEDFNPLVQSCQTYNFLPIRDYGLPFVLQGDFILAANREDVLQDNDWNRAVIAGASDLFVKSVHTFIRNNIMKYTWPRYLETQGKATSTAFAGFIDRMVTNLRTEKIIESCGDTMETPNMVECVPEVYKDASDPPQPLVCGKSGMRSYAGPYYVEEDLAKLRIRPMSEDAFLGLVKKFISNSATNFKELPATWHARLAKALCSVDAAKINDLRIIPLRSGQWVPGPSAKGAESAYFPHIDDASGNGLTIPQGISINIIEETSAKDRLRAKLFKHLGARRLSADEVYRKILEQHKVHGKEYGSWTLDNLVEHAWFLFTSSKPRNCDIQLLLIASSNASVLCVGPEVYMDDPEDDFRLDKYFDEPSPVKYIHGRYLSVTENLGAVQAAEWINWLQQVLGVRTIPRLTAPGSTNPGLISPEFQYLIDARHNNEWLQVLRSKWSHYVREVATSSTVQQALSNAKVRCTDSLSRALKDTYFASKAILSEPLARDRIPFLQVGDPKDEVWLSLFYELGLNMTPGWRLYLTVLRKLRTDSHHKYTEQDVRRLYERLSKMSGQDRASAEIKSAFQNEPLIYVDSSVLDSWMKLSDCWWSAPDCLRGKPKLDTRYAELKDFFLNKLGAKVATPLDVANELYKLSGKLDRSTSIKELLLWLASSTKQWHKTISEDIYSKAVFPVKNIQKSLRSALDPDWFIPDKESLRIIFTDKVALLDFNHEEIQKMLPLFEKLVLRGRSLSASCRERTEVIGSSTYNALSTRRLQSKALYISCLADESERDNAFQEISKIKVKYASLLVLRRYVKIKDRPVYGKNEDGWLALLHEEDVLVVYFSMQFTDKYGPPFPELTDRLVNMFKIPRSMEGMLQTIMFSESDRLIEHQMQRKGISVPKRAHSTNTEKEETQPRGRSTAIQDENAQPQRPRAIPVDSSTSRDSEASSSEASLDASFNEVPNPLLSQAVRHALPVQEMKAAKPRKENIAASLLSNITNFRADLNLGTSHGDKAPYGENGSAVVSVHKALDLSAVPGLNGAGARTISVSGSTAAVRVTKPSLVTRDSPTDYQQDVGRAGEYFIYEWLKSTIQADYECWTSNLRMHYGLPSFGGDEYEHSDFTVDDPDCAKRMSKWLAENKCVLPKAIQSTQVTYHLEVKTTTGVVNEPFTMSANQIRLATQWHKSDSDICVILRVFHFESSTPSIQAYVDPIGLKALQKMKITPDRYVVEPE